MFYDTAHKNIVTSELKAKLINLINLNRIEFVLGGNIMNEQFLSTYQDIFEQIRYEIFKRKI